MVSSNSRGTYRKLTSNSSHPRLWLMVVCFFWKVTSPLTFHPALTSVPQLWGSLQKQTQVHCRQEEAFPSAVTYRGYDQQYLLRHICIIKLQVMKVKQYRSWCRLTLGFGEFRKILWHSWRAVEQETKAGKRQGRWIVTWSWFAVPPASLNSTAMVTSEHMKTELTLWLAFLILLCANTTSRVTENSGTEISLKCTEATDAVLIA